MFISKTGVHLHIPKTQKQNIMKTTNNTTNTCNFNVAASKSETNNDNRIWIIWGDEQKIIAQFKTMDELVSAGYVQKYAANFGYEHLVNRSLKNWANVEIHNIFVTSANPVYNYGLDFKIWINYTADGINFMKQLNIGSSSLTSAPLQRVMLHIAVPAGFDFDNLENNSMEIIQQWMYNMQNNVYSSFQFSTNAFYKKDAKFRPMLRELSAKHQFIFA